MVKKRIIYKRVPSSRIGLLEAKKLRKQGFKAAQITDAFGIVPKARRGIVVLAFKGKRSIPRGFKTKKEDF
jgi:hypothetical protein